MDSDKMVERNPLYVSSTYPGKEHVLGIHAYSYVPLDTWKPYRRIHVGARVGILTRDRQARTY